MESLMSEKEIATPEQVRAYAESQSWSEPERVPLPHSGLVVLLRKPTKFYDALRRANWPEKLRAKVDAAETSEELEERLTPQDTERILADRPKLLTGAFVQPKVSFEPGSLQFHWSFFPDDDQAYILMYLRGEIDANGVDLAAFRKSQSSPTGNGSADGQQVPGKDAPGVLGNGPG
jgi:hypothetical protein